MASGDITNHSFPIAGIGASAGGLEALQPLLGALPKEFNVALVFIQHLSAKHRSLLPELLSARLPSLVIQEISDGLKVLPGRLYLAPPGKEVRLHGGYFRITAHPEGLIHLPIDEFLASLAEDAGERAVAVILSGAGTDGARGCKAVRAAGGTVYVQDPETTEFDSMPLAAIASGQADAVLAPEAITRELLKIEGIGAVAATVDMIRPAEYDSFYRLLQEKTGSRFNHFKKSVISRRIRRRMYLHGVPTVKDYLDLVSSGDAEAAALASDLLIGVTSFFRDRLAWKVLNNEVVRKLAAGSDGAPVRVWTPASATGEEAYSIAMMLGHELDLAGKLREFHVFATDVNDRALDKAREGRYPVSISADVPREYLQKYVSSSEDGQALVASRELREHIVVARHDLLTDPPFSRLDLIVCRNFLIYLEPEAQDKCIALFHYALKDGGYLFLGNADTPGSRKNALFRSVGRKQCRIYRKIGQMPAARLRLTVPYAAERAAHSAGPSASASPTRPSTGMVQEYLLEEFAPAAVAVDQNYDIVYHNGPTNRYLRQPRGAPTRNLLELLPETLRNRVRGAIYRAGQEGKPIAIRANLALNDEGSPSPQSSPRGERKKKIPSPRRGEGRGDGYSAKRPLVLRISRVRDNLYTIVFEEQRGAAKPDEALPLDADRVEETAIHQLESELAATRQDLQNHIEQLKSLNEEIQSSNEELQAANEELETSREELQSLNEELITVNSQLQEKIEEQDETNNDLNNFLASTNIPTIFLDHRLRVKRFTPAMSRLLKLIPADIGRPIADMSQESLGPGLITDAEAVLDTLVPARQEILIAGTWFIRAVQPYRSGDKRIEGVVVTYSDISELKRVEEHTVRLASFPKLNTNPVLEIAASGAVIFSNIATQRILESCGLDRDDSSPFFPRDLDGILKNLEKKEERSLYREVVVGDRVFGETVHLAPQFNVVRIYAHELTERKRAEEALQKSEELFRLAVDNMPDALSIYDAEQRYVFVNDAGLRRIGRPLEELVGQHIGDIYDEESRAAFRPALMKAYETGATQIVETVLTMPTGRYDLIITFVPMKKDGKVHQVLGFTFDITDRKRAEEMSGRLAALVQTADDAIISKDVYGVIQTWNIGAENIFGYTAAEAVGRNISFLLPPGHNDEVPGIIQRILRGEHIEHYESLRMRKNGAVIPVSLTYSAIKDARGTVIGISKIAHDVTERKKAEEALRRAKEDWERTFNTVPDLIALLDCNHNVLRANKSMADKLGVTPEQCVGARCYKVVHGADGPPDFCPHVLTCGDGKEHTAEVHEPRLGGDFLVSTNPMLDGEGKVIGAVHVARDITDRKKAEERLVKMSEDLTARNLELEAFNYSISHDLRAPLRSISGFSRVMMEDYTDKVDDQGRDYLARIRNGSEKMTHLIDDLLRLSKISRQEVDRADYDLSTLAESIIHSLRETSPERAVEVVIEEGVRASVDPDLMRIVMTNLLDNAWKFTGKTQKARIEFGTCSLQDEDSPIPNPQSEIVYFVRDNGAGFDPAYSDKLFWPFHRLHTEKEFPGTGIGLAIVDRIIRRHGGTVWAEGEVGKGAVVYFTLGGG